jgi:hypothetical protein
MEKTLTFDEEVKGWTSFFSFIPEFMTGLNGKFFSFRNGDLWQHNRKTVPCNNFYGEQFTTKVSLVLNDAPSTEKMFKNIFLEGNKTWNVKLNSNLSEGEIFRDEFVKKQSRYFAHTRRNENTEDLTSFQANGIGRVKTIGANSLEFNQISDMIGVGDVLKQQQSGIVVDIGIITEIDRDLNMISFGAFDNAPALNEYCYSTKNARVEGGELRGYYCKLDMENEDTDFTELFAVNCNTAESYV